MRKKHRQWKSQLLVGRPLLGRLIERRGSVEGFDEEEIDAITHEIEESLRAFLVVLQENVEEKQEELQEAGEVLGVAKEAIKNRRWAFLEQEGAISPEEADFLSEYEPEEPLME